MDGHDLETFAIASLVKGVPSLLPGPSVPPTHLLPCYAGLKLVPNRKFFAGIQSSAIHKVSYMKAIDTVFIATNTKAIGSSVFQLAENFEMVFLEILLNANMGCFP